MQPSNWITKTNRFYIVRQSPATNQIKKKEQDLAVNEIVGNEMPSHSFRCFLSVKVARTSRAPEGTVGHGRGRQRRKRLNFYLLPVCCSGASFFPVWSNMHCITSYRNTSVSVIREERSFLWIQVIDSINSM